MLDGILCFFKDGKIILYYMGISMFFEYIVLLEILLVKINFVVLLDKVCLFGCGIIIGIGVVFNMVKVMLGFIVVVFGMGGIGLLVV